MAILIHIYKCKCITQKKYICSNLSTYLDLSYNNCILDFIINIF